MGGTDPHNITAKVLQGLVEVEWQNHPIVDVVLSSRAPHLKKIIEQAKYYSLDMEVSVDVNDMARRMLEADLAIGAGGSTSWERCCLGLPSLIILLASNQSLIYSNLEANGIVIGLGDGFKLDPKTISSQINTLLGNSLLMKTMSLKSISLTNGLGVTKAVRVLNGC